MPSNRENVWKQGTRPFLYNTSLPATLQRVTMTLRGCTLPVAYSLNLPTTSRLLNYHNNPLTREYDGESALYRPTGIVPLPQASTRLPRTET